MSQCQITENQAEQNKSHAVAGIEAHPTPPHGCFFRNDRRNLVHADFERGVAGPELWPPERIDEVDDSERKDNARTKNHENFCGQDALPMSVGPTTRLSRRTLFILLMEMPRGGCPILSRFLRKSGNPSNRTVGSRRFASQHYAKSIDLRPIARQARNLIGANRPNPFQRSLTMQLIGS